MCSKSLFWKLFECSMALSAMHLILIIFLFLWTKNLRCFSEIHFRTRLVTLGSSLKLKCPVNTSSRYAVKWYKDGKQLCRHFGNNELNTTQILKKKYQHKNPFCESTDINFIDIDMTSSGLYTCHAALELEKERKTIRRSVSVLVYPTSGPTISGIKSFYEEGEVIQAICTASPSNPPPSLVWYINGVVAYGWSMVSYPCKMTKDGLCVLRLGLKMLATKNLFPKGIASFVCEAGILALPPKRAYVTSILKGVNNSGNIHLLNGGVFGTIILYKIIFL